MIARPWNRTPPLAATVAEPVTAPLPSPPAAGDSEPAAGPHLKLGGRRIPVILPRRGDPRLKISAVIVALQVLGQTALGFKLSIAQILVTIGVCAVVDTGVTLKRQGVLAWPASALLTGNSIAFILRASGTEHGDWWSLNGIEYFVLAALVSLLVKYLVRPGGRHRFNPSNIGIIWVLLVIGPVHVFPQYLYWGPLGAPVVAALAVIVLGAIWVLRAVRMLPMAVAFLVPFAALIAVFAAGGQSFVTIWSEGPVSGFEYWLRICASPELLVFVCFMMSDPATAARTPVGRIIYGAATAAVAAGLVYFQPTEFGIKVAILASLTVVCALVPLIEFAARRLRQRSEPSEAPGPPSSWRTFGAGAFRPTSIAVILIAVTAVAGTAALAQNRDLVFIERGLTGPRNAQ
ncbi:MAG: RnfABCDGE type electron transport complex subunit D [Actinomycetota bacterium]|nr:RnfABCDGE type electron transport complex subunit D [Actinomycetota bacterium]